MNKIKIFLILVVLFAAHLVKGQSVTSPYSILGIGDFSFDGLVQNQAMGEIGVGYSTIWHINHRNPAWLYRNQFSTFQIGLEGENRTFATENVTERNGTGGLRYLSISLPVMRGKWTSNFGILPYTTVNYNISSNQAVTGSTINARTNLRGEGGLSQVFFNNGFKLFKNFGIGASARYIFGRIENSNNVNLNDPSLADSFQSTFLQATSYSDLSLTGALSFRQALGDDKFINYGVTYELPVGLDGKREETIERRDLFDRVIQSDELVEETDVVFNIPSTLNLGISYEKLNFLALALDVSYRGWEENSGFESGFETFRNTFKVSLGGEIIPSYNDVKSYTKRITYRSGISYEQSPYLVNNRKINDFGINFGASLPLAGISSLDLAFKIGQRGTTEDNLIRETYFRFVFGLTINDRSWFRRRKYD